MEQKHSGFGIASFVISIVSGLSLFLFFVIAALMDASAPNGIDEESAAAMVLGFFVLGFLFLAFVALGLGIAGLVQIDRKKVFAVLGTMFSALVLLCTLGLISIGLAME